MHGIAIAILKYGYLDDNTALRRYSASCGPDHDSRMSKKKKSGIGSDTRFASATNMHGVACISKCFYNHFEFTCQYNYIGLFVAAATVFPAYYRGTTCGRQSGPSMAAILGPGGPSTATLLYCTVLLILGRQHS